MSGAFSPGHVSTRVLQSDRFKNNFNFLYPSKVPQFTWILCTLRRKPGTQQSKANGDAGGVQASPMTCTQQRQVSPRWPVRILSWLLFTFSSEFEGLLRSRKTFECNFFFFIQNDKIRNSFDTYRKVENLSQEGFKAETEQIRNVDNTIDIANLKNGFKLKK